MSHRPLQGIALAVIACALFACIDTASQVVVRSGVPVLLAVWARYAIQASMTGALAASRGSDFHSPTESHTDLGKLPLLPGQLTPVWELLADRVQ